MDNCKNISAVIELAFQCENGNVVNIDFPISLEVFTIAFVLSQVEKNEKVD